MESRIRIGRLVAAKGLDGTLILRHELGIPTAFPRVEAFFIETTPGNPLPFFPLEAKAQTAQESLLRLEGVETREKAQALIRKPVWLAEADMRRLAAGNAPISLLGYAVQEGGNTLGPVLEVIEQPTQILLRLEIRGHEVLIPLNESTLQGIDHDRSAILVQLPEGLLDVYLPPEH